MMGSFYLPGNSWLHRASAGLKLAALMFAGAGLMLVHDWRVLLTVLILVCVLLQQSGAGVRGVWRQVRTLSWFVLFLVAFTAFVQTPAMALEVALRLAAMLLGALVVAMTTSIAHMMDVLIWLLRPFDRIGWINSERVALVFGLTLRLIPELSVQWHEIREAQAARGLKVSPFTMGLPMLLRTIRRAQDIADAIDARQ